MADSPPVPTENVVQPAPVVVKKYANRRLYNTETSSYITLDNLADMIRIGRDFVVYDAKSGEDITRGVLTQIIVEEESKGTSMLPTNFLRQLIGFYGGSLESVVPRYLEQAMSNFARQQQQMRQVMQQTFSPFLPMGVEEIGRQNIAMMERAMSLFNPFVRPGDAAGAPELPPEAPPAPSSSRPVPQETASSPAPSPPPSPAELERLRHEVESLRAQLAIARAEAVMTQAPPASAIPPAPLLTIPAATLTALHVAPDPLGPPAAPDVPHAVARKARNGKKQF